MVCFYSELTDYIEVFLSITYRKHASTTKGMIDASATKGMTDKFEGSCKITIDTEMGSLNIIEMQI